MKTYIYTDNVKKKVLFECQADDILEADKLFQQHTGLDPVKERGVGCEVLKDSK